jgi:hypothetical protein
MKRLVTLSAILSIGLALIGCGGSSTDSNSGTTTNSPFAGSYTGSVDPSSGNLISVSSFTIANDGTITGSGVDASGATGTLSGKITDAGAITVTTTPSTGSPSTVTGAVTLNIAGHLVGTVTNTVDSSTSFVTLGKVGGSLIFAGTFTGTYHTTTGDSGNVQITVQSNGGLAGNVTSTSGGGSASLVGTVSPAGVVVLTVTPTSGSTLHDAGICAYNAAGQLIFEASDGSGDTTTLTVATGM